MVIKSISIEEELNDKLREHCKNTGKKISSLISILLEKYLREENGNQKQQ